MSEKIQPALTPEEWAAFPSSHLIRMDSGDFGVAAVNYFPTPHGIAAMNLHGQPFGFTYEDVDLLHDLTDTVAAPLFGENADKVRALRDRIAALLPPRED